ncbi:hypothetical protein, partial [Vibrio parahaemolyticus]|uniref:hypothetical protein n=1 Tax=Vibrio parahaemolyticus TaxID=670 RepID=UPI000A99E8D3
GVHSTAPRSVMEAMLLALVRSLEESELAHLPSLFLHSPILQPERHSTIGFGPVCPYQPG